MYEKRTKEDLYKKIDNYYTKKIIEYGPSPSGVDWNGQESQEKRFEQLLKVCDYPRKFSINDYGCGYGYLYKFMNIERYDSFDYYGFDISQEMINFALREHGENQNFMAHVGIEPNKVADFSVASGIFNVKLDIIEEDWLQHIITVLKNMNKMSVKGFSANFLTKYSDLDYMRSDLYYADPSFLFDYCMREFSRHVALLHDYGLYEFTLIIRK